MSEKNTTSTVRENVSRAYTRAIEAAGEGGSCCGADSACAPDATASGEAGAESTPTGAVSSFGCGNPLAFAEVSEGQTVLDLGSGAGLDLLAAAEKVGPTGRVIGVDMTEAMIAAARGNVEKAGASNVEIRRGLIEELPVPDASVDWVISNCVINLSPEKPRVFAEIFRVLRPGGRFSISDIVAEGLPEWVRESAAAYAGCVGGAISESEYRAGLQDAGLVDVRVTERVAYGERQVKAIVAELDPTGNANGLSRQDLKPLAGKIWSAKFTGRRPEER